MKKRSITISGHQTSISLEDEFWLALKKEAQRQNCSLNALISQVDHMRGQGDAPPNLSSALRLYILQILQDRLRRL